MATMGSGDLEYYVFRKIKNTWQIYVRCMLATQSITGKESIVKITFKYNESLDIWKGSLKGKGQEGILWTRGRKWKDRGKETKIRGR